MLHGSPVFVEFVSNTNILSSSLPLCQHVKAGSKRLGPTHQNHLSTTSPRIAFVNTFFGASAMSNNQPPATNRQFREVVACLLRCVSQATARNRARPIPLFRMGPPPHAFRFSAVSPRRRGSMPRRMEGIGRGIGRAAAKRCWLLFAGCWLLDIADESEKIPTRESFLMRRPHLPTSPPLWYNTPHEKIEHTS